MRTDDPDNIDELLEYLRQCSEDTDAAGSHWNRKLFAKALEEISRLRIVLSEIEGMHCPDQPAACGYDDASWARRWIGEIRLKAKKALHG